MIPNQRPETAQTRDSVQAEQEALRQDDIRRVRILGINALGLLHRHSADLVALLRRGGTVEVLLLDPESDQFRKRRDAEEKRGGKISNRILAEMEASIAILRDILNQMLHGHAYDIASLRDRFRICLYERRVDRSLLFVETPRGNTLMYKKLPLSPPPPADRTQSVVVDSFGDRDFPIYARWRRFFEEVWATARLVSLDDLGSSLDVLSPRKRDTAHVYVQAVEQHRKRRLDEAAALYRTVLHLEKPQRPTEEQVGIAKRFLPRVYTTKGEPFALKDLVVVIHPDASRRLVGYHLLWQDDIDYLNDNDAADHEVAWVKYAKDLGVEAAWSYWHGAILTTSQAVADANANGFRLRVNTQWGKHGSLLANWQEKVGIDAKMPGHAGLDTMEFKRLKTTGHFPAVGHFAERWPERFEGELEDFVTFPVEVDVRKMIDENPMIAVSSYPNAVLSQWFLPYNIRPKTDWPDAAA